MLKGHSLYSLYLLLAAIDPATGGMRLSLLRADLAARADDWAGDRDHCIAAIGCDPQYADAYLRLDQARRSATEPTPSPPMSPRPAE